MDANFKGNKFTAVLLLLAALGISWLAAQEFMKLWEPDRIAPLEGFQKKMLSDYFPPIKDTQLDTPVYIQSGEMPGGTVFVLGGTHPNEPSGPMTAVMLLENAKVTKGRLIVIPFGVRSGFMQNSAQEASPQFMHFKLPDGSVRRLRYGSRDVNPTLMWPIPDIYIHKASGQELAGNESKNLNRAYPGDPNGTPTEKLAYAIVQLIKQEKVTLAFDLHEASPEYPVVDAIVAHEKSMELAAAVTMELKGLDIETRLEPSPKNLRGLSHREWGDATDVMPILMETGNPSQGRLRGRTDEALALTGKDKAYVKARDMGRLFIPYFEGDQPLDLRVARHLTAIKIFIETLDMFDEDNGVAVDGLPSYEDLIKNGIGNYLRPLKD